MRRILPFVPLAFLAFPAALAAFSGGPLPKLTGGFGEGVCVRCPRSFELNEGRTRGGMFHVLGVPRTYAAGASYPVTVVVAHPGQSRWGFELSARHAGGGGQAGRLVPADDQTQVKESDGLQFLMHTAKGTRVGEKDGPVEFRFNWIAPDGSGGPVVFNAAGNAANGGGSPDDDYIYTAGAYSAAEGGAAAPATTAAARPPEQPAKGARLNTATRVLHLPAPKHLERGSLAFTVQHRFLGAIEDSGPGKAFGLDDGANINLELFYAFTNRLSAGVSRARFAIADRSYAPAIIAWSGTYALRDAESSRWKLALSGGVEGQRNFREHHAPYLQLASSWDVGRFRAYAVPTMIFNSRPDDAVAQDRAIAKNPDDNHTFALGIAADLAVTRQISVAGEYVPRLAGFGGIGRQRPTVAAGVNIQTWRHVFTIMASRSRDFTPARYAVNADGAWTLGFNIYRRIK